MMILQDAWNAVGGLLAVVLAIEILPGLWKRLSRRIRYGSEGKADYRALADAYEGADWVRRYYVDIWKLKIDWAPHVGGRMRPFSAPGITVGEGGLRRTWRPERTDAAAPVKRIYAFGGSTIMGMGVRDEGTVPSLLAKKLAHAGHAVEVVNFGQPAYTAIQSFIAFSEELARGNVPDVVLFLDGLNEAITAEQTGRAGTVFNADSRAEEFNLLQPWRRRALVRHVLHAVFPRIMRRYQTLEDVIRPAAPSPSDAPALDAETIEPLSRAVARRHLGNLRLIRAIAEDNGVAPLFFWQPMLFTKKHLSDHEARYQLDGAPVPDLRRPLFRAIYEAMRSDPGFRAMEGAVDISGLFDDSPEPWFIDPFHLAEKGNGAVVDAMMPHVVAALEKS